MTKSRWQYFIWFSLSLFIVLMGGGNCCLAEDRPKIEIIADGRRYGSFQEYLDARRNARALRSVKVPADKGFHELWARPLGAGQRTSLLSGRRYFLGPKDVDRYIARRNLIVQELQGRNGGYDPFFDSYRRISRFGFNTGVAMVVEDFWKNTNEAVNYKRLMARDLEKTLIDSFGDKEYEGPILIISNQKKLRIMTLEDQDGPRASEDVSLRR